MITAQQIKERMDDEKDPFLYLDGELSCCLNQMGDRCEVIQDTISVYNERVNKDDRIDMQKIKEELKKIGELYYEVNIYEKVRKEHVKSLKRADQLNKAQVKHKKWIGQMKK